MVSAFRQEIEKLGYEDAIAGRRCASAVPAYCKGFDEGREVLAAILSGDHDPMTKKEETETYGDIDRI